MHFEGRNAFGETGAELPLGGASFVMVRSAPSSSATDPTIEHRVAQASLEPRGAELPEHGSDDELASVSEVARTR